MFKICALCDNRFNYTPEQLTYWADRIVSKYPKLTLLEIEKTIQDGTEGKYRGVNFSTHICFATICEWLDKLSIVKASQFSNVDALFGDR